MVRFDKLRDIVSKADERCIVHIWSSWLSASSPTYELTVKQLRTEYVDLLEADILDFRIGSSYISVWCRGVQPLSSDS